MAVVTLTVQTWTALYDALRQAVALPASAQFNFASLLNRKAIQPVIDALAEVTRPSPAMADYLRKQKELTLKHRDPKPPKPPPTGCVAVLDRDAYDKELADLRLQYKDTLESMKAREGEIRTMLAGNHTLSLTLVSPDTLPDGLEGRLFDALMPMIDGFADNGSGSGMQAISVP